MHLQRHTSLLLSMSLSIDNLEQVYRSEVDNKEGLQRWSSTIGIFTAIAGNILISFALNIQRFAHIKIHEKKVAKILNSELLEGLTTVRSGDVYHSYEQAFMSQDHLSPFEQSDEDHPGDKTYLSSPYWWIGIFLMTLGEAGNFLAYGFAPASIVSPLGVVALISNCVIAPIILKEKFRLRDFGGVTVAIAGAITVVMSAKQKEQKLGPHEIIEAIIRTEFKIYMIITLFLIGILAWASPKFGSKTILIDLGLVGLLGGYTALSTKGVSSMLSSTLWRALTTPVSYMLVLILVGTAVLQVKYLNKALQRFDSTQVIPVQFVAFTLSVITGSAILYRDLEKTSTENAMKFAGGCLLAFLGVWLITSGRPSNEIDGNKRNITSQEVADEQISQLNVDESLRPTSTGNLSGDRELSDAPTSTNVKASSKSNSDVSRIFSYPFSKKFTDITQTIDSRDTFSEVSPLLGKNVTCPPDQLPQRFHSVNERPLPTQIQNLETQTSVMNPSGISATPRPSFSRHTDTPSNIQQRVSPPRVANLQNSATPNQLPVSRLKAGPLISPLSGELCGATIDSFRRGANSTIRCRALNYKYRSRPHFISAPLSGIYNPSDRSAMDSEPRVSSRKENEISSKKLLSVSLDSDHRKTFRTRARSLSDS